MSTTAFVKDALSANETYAASLSSTEKSLPLPPGRKVAILTCMDARLDPKGFLGLGLGEAHVIRNAGAVAQDALRSLVISQQLLGTEEVLVIKHTGCGMLTFENKDIHAVIQKNLGVDATDTDYFPYSNLETAVQEDVRFLRDSKLLSAVSKEKISGWIYEVETGKVRRIA